MKIVQGQFNNDLSVENERLLKFFNNLVGENKGVGPNQGTQFPLKPGDAWVTKRFFDTITSQSSQMGTFRQYIFQMHYFSGKYNLEGDLELKKVEQILFENVFNFGVAGLKVLNVNGKQTYVPVSVTNIQRGMNGEIEKADGVFNLVLGNKKQNKINTPTIPLTKDNTAFLMADSWMMPAFFYWWDFCYKLDRLWRILETNARVSIKKFIYSVANNSSRIGKVERNSFLNPDNPFVTLVGNPTSFYTKTQRENDKSLRNAQANMIKEFKGEKGDPLIIDLIDKFVSLWYFHIGRRVNVERKKQRNINNEVKSQEANFLILEQPFERQLDLFCEQLSRITGKEIRFTKTVEELNEYEQTSEILNKEQENA